METQINTKFKDFKLKAYHNDEFIDIEGKNILGKWAIFFFSIQLILHLFVLLN
jgi:alkyl hydroperoxide reductase subunit AhpC